MVNDHTLSLRTNQRLSAPIVRVNAMEVLSVFALVYLLLLANVNAADMSHLESQKTREHRKAQNECILVFQSTSYLLVTFLLNY